MEQIDWLFNLEKPPLPISKRRLEPALRIARVLLLRAPTIAEDTVIREVHLRPGLNILWARNAPTSLAPEPASGLLTGHSAGKTTFCRLIRYLLGEPRFGTRWIQEQIRKNFPEGWVVGEVFVNGVPWAVGRPLGLHVHPFAVRGADLASALGTNEGYKDFLEALNTAIVSPLKVKLLPHSGVPIDWLHVLPWLARDQEARFEGIIAWRSAQSESEGLNPPATDRYVVARGLLDVVTDDEVELERSGIAIAAKKQAIGDEAWTLQLRADENRRQLKERLGLTGGDLTAEPLSMHTLRTEVERRRKELALRVEALRGLQADAARAEQAWMAAHESAGDAHVRDATAKNKVGMLRVLAEDLGKVTQSLLLEDLEARPGRCNVKAEVAKEGGCPLFVVAPIPLEARRGQTEAKQQAESAEKELEGLTAQADHLSRLAKEAKTEEARLRDEHRLRHKEFSEEQLQVVVARAKLEEIEQRLARLDQADERVVEKREEQTEKGNALERVRAQKRGKRRSPTAALERLSSRFAEVLRALLGPSVQGRVELTSEGELVARITGRREQRGAAMDTVSVLAFDLAALTLGIEGDTSFPGFLIHDGPREADLDLPIYAQLFRYAAQLEQKCEDSPGFQYIVTTTTPPPEELQDPERWLLAPVLDASLREGRLFREDL